MIKGFEDLTDKLSEKEIKLAMLIAGGFNDMRNRGKIGKEFKSTVKYFTGKLKERGIIIDDVTFRKIIQYIRANELVFGLCSDSRGYWLAGNQKEFYDTIVSLHERIRSQMYTYEAMKRQYNRVYNKQPDQPKPLI